MIIWKSSSRYRIGYRAFHLQRLKRISRSYFASATLTRRFSAGFVRNLEASAQKHPVKALESAAQKALHHGVWRLRDLRALLEQSAPSPQLDFLETHPLIRNLDTYRDCVPDCFATATSTLNPT